MNDTFETAVQEKPWRRGDLPKGVPDALPPHDDEQEKAVLGCIFLKPDVCLPATIERIGDQEGVFYDLRNEKIFEVMRYLHVKAEGVDLVTVQGELKNRGLLDQVGGIPYISRLEDGVPSVENLPNYLDAVWEKYVARRLIQQNFDQANGLINSNGQISESFITVVEGQVEQTKKLLTKGLPTPKNLCECAEFGDEYLKVWFEQRQDEYGLDLPFPFPMKIRPCEMTLFTGDNGSGKSSLLGQISICASKQFEHGEKIVVASMEVPPQITLWIMARQLIGKGHLEWTDVNEELVRGALAWLNKRILLYNFLGITDWRELLNTFRYAKEHRNAEIFIIDSVMRIGIPDDDYAQQGFAASQFADFAVKTGAHVFLVVHENKGDKKGNKDKVRGSKQWTDNAHNICGVKRNEEKAQKLQELEQQRINGKDAKGQPYTEQQFNEDVAKQRRNWDAKFILSKQRWPGSQQNGSRWLWFDKDSLQFRADPETKPRNYMKE